MGKIDLARRLGAEHGRTRDVPYSPADGSDVAGYEPWYPEGYVSYVYWDAGSARLLDDLGETGATDERVALVRACCEAYAVAAGVEFDTAC